MNGFQENYENSHFEPKNTLLPGSVENIGYPMWGPTLGTPLGTANSYLNC